MSFLRFLLMGVFSALVSASLSAVDGGLAAIPGYKNHVIFCYNLKENKGYLFRPCNVECHDRKGWYLDTYADDGKPVKLCSLDDRGFAPGTLMWAHDYTTLILNFSGDGWCVTECPPWNGKLLSVCISENIHVVVFPSCFVVDGAPVNPHADLLSWHLDNLKTRFYNFINGGDLGALRAFSKFCSHSSVDKDSDKSALAEAIKPFIEKLFELKYIGVGSIEFRSRLSCSATSLLGSDSESDSESDCLPSPEPHQRLSNKRIECSKEENVLSPTLVSCAFTGSHESLSSQSKRARNIFDNTVEMKLTDN